ncbi:glycosyltransferase family 2 protein [Microbacterium aerolatum]|uniref:Glycosyl transferase n=1 Tax=Microbacterium aerolatum TaxID=153731 RepID=A0A511ADL2_9MICO|nr:glycosyltransferase [Microbacterium aerolatum]GEK86229.1 glycosyl transferase [Microbacterium aerolatum]GGB16289.1 glycosyl transferase [Microbacterium aerolatum]
MAVRPTVSIIMAEFNTQPEHLQDVLRCVVAQSFPDFELILVDDRGANDVGAIVDALSDPRLRVIVNPKNLGFVEALHVGLAAARADLLIRMDTDDLYEVDHISKLVQAASSHPEYAVISTMSREISDDGRTILLGREGEKTAKDLIRGNALIHPATLIRRSAIERVGGYPREFPRAEDLALWCEFLLAGERLYMTGDITHSYRVDLGNYKKRRLRYRAGELRARWHYYPRLGASPFDYLKLLRSVLGGILPGRFVRFLRRVEANTVGRQP